jgi:hypothetical protein
MKKALITLTVGLLVSTPVLADEGCSIPKDIPIAYLLGRGARYI